MKKVLLIFSLIIILSLCSCRKINQPDDTNYAGSNSSELNSDISFTTSDIVLPERDEPTSSTNSSSVSENDNDTVTSHDSIDNSTPAVTLNAELAIDLSKPYYRSSVKTLSITLYNEKKSKFTYYTDFFLQRYENGEWIYHTTQSGEINYEYKTAESTSHVQFIVYDITKLYKTPLPFGTY